MIFVPHYLSIFWAPLRTNPWDIIVGIALTWLLVGHQHRRHPGGGEAEHLPRGGRLRDAAAARRARLLPDLPVRTCCWHNVHFGVAPTLERVPARDPGGDDRLHRDRDRLEPRRGGARPGALDPTLDLVGRDRRLRDLLHAAVDRALGDAGRRTRAGTTSRSSARTRRTDSRTTRCSASSRTSACTASCCRPRRSTSASSPRRSSSSRRTRA